jgi:HEAT repeat protein
MRSSLLSAALFLVSGFPGGSFADDAVKPSADAVNAAFDKFVQAASKTDWPAELEAREALLSLGSEIVPKLTDAAQVHSDSRVRRSCYDLLTRSFAGDERTSDTLLDHGLHDRDDGIRYQSAFLLGDFKIQRAEPALRAAYAGATGKDDQFFRFTLAKSIAQLGQSDVLPVLVAAVSDDRFMSRHVGNIGLKSLTGRNLDDFRGYTYGEGAWVTGGIEMMVPFDPVQSVERKAARFEAAKAYLAWLKTERPELYNSLSYRPMSRRTEAYAKSRATTK